MAKSTKSARTAKSHSGFTANPGSGVSDDKNKKSSSKKGAPLMSQNSWDKLSKKTQEIEFHGSRFSGRKDKEVREGGDS